MWWDMTKNEVGIVLLTCLCWKFGSWFGYRNWNTGFMGYPMIKTYWIIIFEEDISTKGLRSLMALLAVTKTAIIENNELWISIALGKHKEFKNCLLKRSSTFKSYKKTQFLQLSESYLDGVWLINFTVQYSESNLYLVTLYFELKTFSGMEIYNMIDSLLWFRAVSGLRSISSHIKSLVL